VQIKKKTLVMEDYNDNVKSPFILGAFKGCTGEIERLSQSVGRRGKRGR